MSRDEISLLAHLAELRQRLLYSLLAIAIVFGVLVFFSQDLYTLVAKPLLVFLPPNSAMVATQVTSPFLIPLKLTLVVSLFLAMPFILYQLWAFVAPGLYRTEKRLALPLLATSVLLFYVGVAFAYFVVLPIAFKFFVSALPEGVSMMTDISQYLDFVLVFFFAFGIAFEAPIATLLLVLLKITTTKQLAEWRPYIVIAAFLIGAILTPPDVLSQILLAIPLWMLFEIGLYVAQFFEK